MQYGTWCLIPSPEVVDIVSRKLDFVILDREHGNASDRDIFNMITAASATDTDAFVRVSSNNEREILHALDSGATGIIVPHVHTALDIKKIADFALFPPEGNRGYTPFVHSSSYHPTLKYKEATNARVFIGIIIEDMEGVNNLREILSECHINMVYIGVYDLASSLGVGISDLKKEMEEISNICHDFCTDMGAIYSDKETLKNLADLDVEYAVYKTDTAVLYDGFSKMEKADEGF